MGNQEPIHILVKETAELNTHDLALIHELFDHAYQQPNHAYLENSFSILQYIALAMKEKELVGFALADTVKTFIPR